MWVKCDCYRPGAVVHHDAEEDASDGQVGDTEPEDHIVFHDCYPALVNL